MTYTSYAWFFEDEPNTYAWSYCNINEDYFTNFRPNSHEMVVDVTEKSTSDCTIFEHFSVNYPTCQPNAPGFISVGA